MANKSKNDTRHPASPPAKKRPHTAILFAAAAAAVIILITFLVGNTAPKQYSEKIALLEKQICTAELRETLGRAPAGEAGHAVFISVCDTMERASVYSGTGRNLASAWRAAEKAASTALKRSGLEPVWVKADVVCYSQEMDRERLGQALQKSWADSFRCGIAFDGKWNTALLEEELNGGKIYDYTNSGIDLLYLNDYLGGAGRKTLDMLPERYTVFQCRGWFCDENSSVYELINESADYGRRQIDSVDADYAEELILSAVDFLTGNLQDDGSFLYGIYPRFDNDIDNYNIVRHAGTVWPLISGWRIRPNEELKNAIDSSLAYMLDSIVYDEAGNAYLYERKDNEIKLGGCGLALITLTEYMDAFGTDQYTDLCRQLGSGILTMLDQSTGEYYHVLNGDFSRKEKFRTVYYDGEATFGLCRLYSLTGERIWLDAAERAVEHFITEDYSRYQDHWVAYSMNEITRYTDDPDYYAFAMHNIEANLEAIRDCDITYHTYLELLMAGYETYERMLEKGISGKTPDEKAFLETIRLRADRMLSGYFYPEYAMYMENPARILNTFMVRHDGFRIRIDDIQHNITGYCLYRENYDRLIKRGMPV